MRIRTGIALVGTIAVSASIFATAAPAHAAPIPKGPHVKVTKSGTTITITDASKGSVANGDFDNLLDVKFKRDEGYVYVQDEAGSALAGAGCTVGSFTEDTSHNRPEDTWAAGWGEPWEARCPIAGVKKLNINVGAGDDIAYVLLSPVPVTITGGAGSDDLEYFSLDGDDSTPPYFSTSTINGGLGDDYLVGGRGNDTINGERGYDWVEGTCGNDTLNGGSEDDSIDAFELGWGNNDCGPTKDVINCGDGTQDGADIDQGVDVVNVNCESTFTA